MIKYVSELRLIEILLLMLNLLEIVESGASKVDSFFAQFL